MLPQMSYIGVALLTVSRTPLPWRLIRNTPVYQTWSVSIVHYPAAITDNF